MYNNVTAHIGITPGIKLMTNSMSWQQMSHSKKMIITDEIFGRFFEIRDCECIMDIELMDACINNSDPYRLWDKFCSNLKDNGIIETV